MIARILGNPSFRAACYYAASGVFFVVGTLLLARVLPPEQFGALALALALTNLGMFGGTSGLVGVWLRHDIRSDAAILRVSIAVCVTTAIGLGAFGMAVYDIDMVMLVSLVAAVVGGGLLLLGLVPLQKVQRFHVAVPLSQVPNFVVFASAVLLAAVPISRLPWVPIALIALATIGLAYWAWCDSLRRSSSGGLFRRGYWGDVMQFTSVAVAAELLIQLERLLIPFVLDLEQLALFAVVAAVAVAPFSTLEKAANATLIPRLQSAPDIASRRDVLLRETVLFLAMALVGGSLIFWLGPPIIEYFVQPSLRISDGLILAAIVSGAARMFSAVSRSLASAFCSATELRRLSTTAWIATGFSAAAGFGLSRFGLVGLIAGVASGWLIRGVAAFLIARPHLARGDPRRDAGSEESRCESG